MLRLLQVALIAAILIMASNENDERGGTEVERNGSQLMLITDDKTWEFTIVDSRRRLVEPFQMLGDVPDDVLDALVAEGYQLR